MCPIMVGWLGGVVVRALTRDREIVSSTPGCRIAGNNSGQVVHTHVTKQYNLVPAKGR